MGIGDEDFFPQTKADEKGKQKKERSRKRNIHDKNVDLSFPRISLSLEI